MFALADVILPFADPPPAEAIRAALARFQRGGPGDVPRDGLAFDNETDDLRAAHEARFTFTGNARSGLSITGGSEASRCLDSHELRDEMWHLGVQT